MAELELGQMFLSNNTWQEYDADWATEGLRLVADVIAESQGQRPDKYGCYPNGTLAGNCGADEYETDVFVMRGYCWCDGEGVGHEEGCPPNFVYKPTGVIFTWYKHAGRGITCNRKYPGAIRWFKVLNECVESIKGKAE